MWYRLFSYPPLPSAIQEQRVKSFSETREHLLALTFFNDFEARTVEAICERIIPGGDGDAGATEAGVVYYIDLALAGFSISLQNVYRLGLRELELDCRRLYGTSFVDLDSDRQDDVVREFLGPEVSTAAGTRSKSESDTSDRHLLDRTLRRCPRACDRRPIL